MKTYYVLPIMLLLLIAVPVAGCTQQADNTKPPESPPAATPKLEKIPEITEMEKELGVMLTERGVKYLVDPEKIVSGGPPKDGIPSIDDSEFVTLTEADEWIADNELVLATIYKGIKRVYPLQIMVWHEIVNDVIAGDPLLITY